MDHQASQTGKTGFSVFPLRFLITVPVLLLALAASGLVGIFSYFDAGTAVGDVAAQLRAEVLARVDQRLREYLAIPPAVNAHNVQSLSLGLLDPDDPRNREVYFYEVALTHPSIAYSFYGRTDGQFCGVRRLAGDDIQVVRAGPETGGDSHNFSVSVAGRRVELKQIYPGFDPRTRPWYKAGVAARRAVWTPIYRHFALRDMALTAALPAYDDSGRLLGVFGVDYVLGQIRDFLSQIRVGRNGGVFLMERSGDLVAASAMPPDQDLFVRQDDAYARIKAASCGLPMVEGAARTLADGEGGLYGLDRERLVELTVNDERVLVQAAPFQDDMGLDWIMVVTAPEADFLSGVASQGRRILVMLLLVAAAAAGAGIFIAGRISAPVEELSQAAVELSEGRWDFSAPLGESAGHVREMRQLTTAFDGMRRQVKESFAELEARNATIAEQNRTLEERVARRTQEYKDLNNRLRAIFDAIPGHIHVIGRDFRVVDVGDKMLRAMGMRRENVVGRLCHEVFRGVGEICGNCPVVRPEAVTTIAIRPSTPEEEARLGMAFMVYSAPVLDENGEVWGFIECLMDISELRAMERELVRAKEMAEEAAQAKGEFLAGMSHEIRTPLNSIIGLTEITLQTELGRDQRDHLQTVREAGRSLLALVNDILDFSRLGAKGVELHEETFSLPRLMSSVARTLRIQARKKGLGLRARMKKGCPMASRGDADRLRQVLVNLVGNALKFTEKGEVEMWAEPWSPAGTGAADPGAGARAWVKFFVRDTGIGIPPGKLPVIFDPFRQADGSITRRYGGTGLGLAICKQLVERMGGEIGVESTPGQGSTFFFTLPLAPGDPAEVRKTGREGPPMASLSAAEHPLRVLLVEDNAMNVKLARALLVRLGHAGRTASHGREAIEILSQETFDVVLMDLEMPELDGLSATRLIREGAAGEAARNIPVVAMTAHAVNDVRRKCQEAGMSGFVAKPIDFAELSRILAVVVPETTVGTGGTPAPASEEPQDRDRQPGRLDVTEAMDKLGNDAELYLDLCRLYMEELPGRRAAMARMSTEGSADELFRMAHSCKNSCGAIGAMTCVELASLAERAARTGDVGETRRIMASLEAEMLLVSDRVAHILEEPEAFGLDGQAPS